MAKVKAHEIREKPKAELLQQLDTLNFFRIAARNGGRGLTA